MQRHSVDSLQSTSGEAARIVSSPDPGVALNSEQPFVVVAAEQHAPRLVLGGLWMTVAWPMRQALADYDTAVLAADLALAEVIEPIAQRQVQLAWPGDLLLGSARVAAVRSRVVPPLNATRRPPTLLLTIAVYADLDPGDLPRADYPQTSLKAEGAGESNPHRLADRLIPRLRDRLIEHEHSGPTRYMIDQLRARLAFMNETVRIEVSGSPREGTVLGLAEDGRLLASIHGRTFPVPSGRVFIPFAPAAEPPREPQAPVVEVVSPPAKSSPSSTSR